MIRIIRPTGQRQCGGMMRLRLNIVCRGHFFVVGSSRQKLRMHFESARKWKRQIKKKVLDMQPKSVSVEKRCISRQLFDECTPLLLHFNENYRTTFGGGISLLRATCISSWRSWLWMLHLIGHRLRFHRWERVRFSWISTVIHIFFFVFVFWFCSVGAHKWENETFEFSNHFIISSFSLIWWMHLAGISDAVARSLDQISFLGQQFLILPFR